MFCMHCGAKLPENAAFCTNCGTSIKPKTEAGSCDPSTKNTEPSQAPTPEAKPSERDDEASIRKIIGTHAEYYLSQFEAIKGQNLSKFNWAACLGGLFHAAYRGVWTQWLRFMKIPLATIGVSLLVAVIWVVFSAQSAFMIAAVLAILSSVLSFVWQAFRYPKQFNRIYFEHVTKKLSLSDERPDPSVWRIIATILLCISLSSILSLLSTFSALSMFGANKEDTAVHMEQTTPIAPKSTTGYEEFNSSDSAPTYEDTGNSFLDFLNQNYLDASKWISGTDFDCPSFTIKKTDHSGYTFTIHEAGMYFRENDTPVEIDFIDGKAYGIVNLRTHEG